MNEFFGNVWEKTKDVADTAGKKAGDAVELSKYKIECIKLDSEIKKLYEQLGSSVYSMKKGGYENRDLIDSLSEEIDEAMERLRELNDKIADVKKQNVCPVCKTKNPKENFYCAKCGSKIKSEFEEASCCCEGEACGCECDCACEEETEE